MKKIKDGGFFIMRSIKFTSLIIMLLMVAAVFFGCADAVSESGDTSASLSESNSESESTSDTDAESDTESDSTADSDTESESSDTSDTESEDDESTDVPEDKREQHPIAYFSFDTLAEDGSFVDDMSGSKCASSGNPTQSPIAKSGKSLYLNGSSYLSFDMDESKLPTGKDEHTVTAWVRISNSMTSNLDGVIAGWGEYRHNSDTRLLIYKNQFCASSYGILTTFPVPDSYKSEWLHLAMTFSDNTYRMYLNGTVIGYVKGNGSTDIQPTDIFIGGFGAAGLNFIGMLDELCIYDVALTPAEIIENMNGDIYFKGVNGLGEMLLFEGADTQFESGWNTVMYNGKTTSLTFKLYIPRNYDPSKKYPIITFMSGDGAIEDALDETVGGNESVYLNKSIIEGEDCICIVPYMSGKWLTVPNDTGTVFPYKDYSMSDAKPSIDFEEVRRLLADCIDTLAVDKDRVYFIGYSRGAMAGFYWLADDPDLFAGAILCCGASDPNAAAIYKETAVWMFIGGSDTKVDVNRFKAIYDAYAAAGGDGKYTEYPGADHSLKYYLANQEGVVEWLFSQTKAK